MQLTAFRHLWGLEHVPVPTALAQAAAAGYAGVEASVPPDAGEREQLHAALRETGLQLIPEILLMEATPEAQLAELETELAAAAPFAPPFVVSHSGRDAWPLDIAIDFYREAVALEARAGIPIAHETHRGRPLFTPWTTRTILEAVPELRLCCDFSHWVCVGERLLEDQQAEIELAARHALHVHTRVGYEQGPQAPDPRAPEFAAHREAFAGWWRQIWSAQRAAGVETSTFTPEYGPPPYLHTLPFTEAPVVRLAELCDEEADRVRDLFAAWREGAGAAHHEEEVARG